MSNKSETAEEGRKVFEGGETSPSSADLTVWTLQGKVAPQTLPFFF